MAKTNKSAKSSEQNAPVLDEHGAEAAVAVENDFGAAALCDCGGVNLSMGPMTLHLAHHEVQAVQELLAGALALGTSSPEQEALTPGDAEWGPKKNSGLLH